MSVTAESFYSLYDDNQKTSAFGWAPYMAATQNGNWDPTLNGIVQLATNFGGAGAVEDARDWAFRKVEGLPTWKKTEASGVHAEVLIIRAWIAKAMVEQQVTEQVALDAPRGRAIYASQKACWCCHALMGELGIVRGDDTLGSKPLMGWRHPLAARTIPNSELPTSATAINREWLAAARK